MSPRSRERRARFDQLPPGLFGAPRAPLEGLDPVKVLIDASASVSGHKGLGRFQSRLVTELGARFPHLIHATVLLRPNSPLATLELPPGWRTQVVKAKRGIVRAAVEIPRLLNSVAPDVVFTTADRLRAPGMPGVVLYVFEHPIYRTRTAKLVGTGRFDLAANASNLLWFRRTVKRADRVVAASTSTARDLFFLSNVDPARISVAMPGPFIDVASVDGGTRERGVLVFIDRDPRDNGEIALRAFRSLPNEWVLHVVGDADAAVSGLLRRLDLSGRVVLHGRVPDGHVAHLMSTCSVLLEATLYEGFGAQTAEAMVAGMLCVVSWVTSLPELVAEVPGTWLVNPHDVESVTNGLLRAIAAAPPPRLEGATEEDGWATLCGHLVRLFQDLREQGEGRSARSGTAR